MATDRFPEFAQIVADRFQVLVARPEAFVVDVEGDDLYQAYLEAFPEGTNPLFKERTEHDCSCCKHFIRRAGMVVAVDDDGELVTVWDVAAETAPAPYDEVATILRGMVLEAPVCDLFRVAKNETGFGAKTTRSQDENGDVLTWNHFFTGEIPKRFRLALPDKARGDYRTTVQVFERGLQELADGALELVVSLIDANNLYRGAEHREAVIAFQKAKRAWADAGDPSLWAWTNARGKASRFRNTVIGTLVTDLSEGKDVEEAVRAFETKVAPHNYKRTKAIITPGMVKQAMKTIEELGLEPALERRFARIDDISVNDVLWVDSSVKPLMKGGLGDVLMKEAKATLSHDADEDRAEAIRLDAFMKKVLPKATGMELLFKGDHLGNLMSLTAPVHEEPAKLFRWDNDFAWSYAGNIADSIKERVKRAGGQVTGVSLRCSLSWWNLDDLDIHVRGPGGHIYHGSRHGRCGGALDVDMNVAPDTREAVENVVWRRPLDGTYRVSVHNYTWRESTGIGFVIEMENNGKLHHFNYPREVRQSQEIPVVDLVVQGGNVVDMKVANGISTTAIKQEKWGLTTEGYVKVNAVTLSPNHWGANAVGNKHTFFVLDGALNDEPCRGIYNEFLHPRLEEHRKVFEVIGDKTKCQPTDGQLSGLGFSSTKPDSVIVKVTEGKKQRLFNVQIGA